MDMRIDIIKFKMRLGSLPVNNQLSLLSLFA